MVHVFRDIQEVLTEIGLLGQGFDGFPLSSPETMWLLHRTKFDVDDVVLDRLHRRIYASVRRIFPLT